MKGHQIKRHSCSLYFSKPMHAERF